MSSLITINNTSALHLPTADASPVHLANGDLTLVLIPANPPAHPSETLTLSIGASSFPLLPNSPLQKVQTTNEHPTFQFTPVPADGGAGVGQVRIQLAPSKNQEQWDATEAQAKQLESLLRAYKLWDEKILFVNDEYETTGEPVKGWGETVASTLAGGASFLAGKIAGFTDRFPELISSHLQHPPGKPVLPTTENAAKVTAVRNATAQAAVKADEAAVAIGNKVHDAGVKLGEKLPDELARPSPAVQQGEKGEARKLAEEGWHQATIAAKGLADAAATIGGSISGNAHKAIEHNYGTEADRVAQDVGQAGANVGQAALSAGKATSVIIQGNNVAQGAAQGKSA